MSQIKVPVSFSSCQLPSSAAKIAAAEPVVTTAVQQSASPLTLNAVLNNKKRKTITNSTKASGQTNTSLQVLTSNDVANAQHILQIHQRTVTDGLLTAGETNSGVKRQRVLSNQQNLELVETQLVVTDQVLRTCLLLS